MISFRQIKTIERNSVERSEAVGEYLGAQKPGFVDRVRRKAKVTDSMVYRVLHGSRVSASVEKVLLALERSEVAA